MGGLLSVSGCDAVYRYVVFPPARVEYTIVPSPEALKDLSDTCYRLSGDKLSVIYDRKDFKIEVKYMNDYQLNNYEFPEQSQAGQFSTNPFTFGNWVDPATGFTPQRFSVFKVTMYNYAASKVNLDPENCILRTDWGDNLNSYGREEKNSRYLSLEAYFKRRKGTSGVDDDVFESRMGIIRRTVHYLGKPVFRGEVRDGLIVFDPLSNEVDQLRLDFKDFILGYDENNTPSEFGNYSFYFKRVPFEAPEKGAGFVAGRIDSARQHSQLKQLDPKSRPGGEIKIAVRTTNLTPIADLMKPLDQYMSEYTNYKMSYAKTTLMPAELAAANVLMIMADEGEMKFSADHERYVAEFVKNGGIIIADERSTTAQSENWQAIANFLSNIGALLGGQVSSGRVPLDHPIYSLWKRFDALPPGDADLLNVHGREKIDFMSGIFYSNRLVMIYSNRGYATSWGAFGPPEARSGKDFTRQRDFLANIFYYALESKKVKN
ncbi:MAG: DUF4159 domain-containing protein [Ignavibacteriales bacterium]|nr:DUF4159 domain-containing protein [Ignavibacteriales bacterium]